MARVRKVGTIKVGARKMPVRRVSPITSIVKATIEATTTQNRIIAEELREMVLDRLWAATPPPPGKAVVPRPKRMRRVDIPTADREPLEQEPLRANTVKRKAKANLDGRKLIETGDLMRGIEVFRGVQAGLPYYMTRFELRAHEGSRETRGGKRFAGTLNQLMRIHEFGSAAAKIPPRPTWRPVVQDMLDWLRSRKFKKSIKAESLRSGLRRIR